MERKWPEKYNTAGHRAWSGRVYGPGLTRALGWRRERIYHGVWGGAPFQSLYEPVAGTLGSLPLMPEWYLVILGLAALAGLGMAWTPLLLAVPLLVLAVGAPFLQAGLGAANASFMMAPRSRLARLELRSLTMLLFLIQPLARLAGRLRNGLTPWRLRGRSGLSLPRPRSTTVWSERWRAPEAWLGLVEAALRAQQAPVRRGSEYDRWDLEVRGGILGAVRLHAVIEEHGAGRQLVRFRSSPRCLPRGIVLAVLFVALAAGAALDAAWVACGLLSASAAALALRIHDECATATASILGALRATESLAAETGIPEPEHPDARGAHEQDADEAA